MVTDNDVSGWKHKQTLYTPSKPLQVIYSIQVVYRYISSIQVYKQHVVCESSICCCYALLTGGSTRGRCLLSLTYKAQPFQAQIPKLLL